MQTVLYNALNTGMIDHGVGDDGQTSAVEDLLTCGGLVGEMTEVAHTYSIQPP